MADTTRPLLRWLAAHDPLEHVLLACAGTTLPRVARGTVVVRLDGCLKDTGIGLPAQLLAVGVDVVEVLPCPTAPDEAAAQVASWRTVIDGVAPFAPARRVRSRPEVLTLGQIPVPRRVVLGLSLRDLPLDLGLDDAARTITALRLLEAAGRTRPRPTTPHDPGPAQVDGAGPPAAAATLAVTGCTACGVCVRACPHDALVLEHDGDGSTLTHLREDCRSELDCLRLCPVDAISTAGPVPLAELLEEPVVTLSEVSTAACERCGARHPAVEGPLCPPCRFREGNAFGSALPPGVLEKLAALRLEQNER